MAEPSSEQARPAPHEQPGDQPRVHAEEPAEGAPAGAGDPQPREHTEDPAEGPADPPA